MVRLLRVSLRLWMVGLVDGMLIKVWSVMVRKSRIVRLSSKVVVVSKSGEVKWKLFVSSSVLLFRLILMMIVMVSGCVRLVLVIMGRIWIRVFSMVCSMKLMVIRCVVVRMFGVYCDVKIFGLVRVRSKLVNMVNSGVVRKKCSGVVNGGVFLKVIRVCIVGNWLV